MKQRKAGKVARRLALSIGLLCSKTFDDAIFEELFEAKYGLKKADIKKMNIKGVFQIWMHNGDYHEVPLKECHQWTREGCKMCPDFAAEHADISTGGIGKYNDWTLTIVRTDAGRDLMERMLADGVIQIRPGDDDPDAIALMHKLSRRSRKRWPEFALPEPGLAVLPPSRRSCACTRRRDLMDRSKISSAIPDVRFILDGTADVVIVDLGRGAAQVAEIRGRDADGAHRLLRPARRRRRGRRRPRRRRRRRAAPISLLPRPAAAIASRSEP